MGTPGGNAPFDDAQPCTASSRTLFRSCIDSEQTTWVGTERARPEGADLAHMDVRDAEEKLLWLGTKLLTPCQYTTLFGVHLMYYSVAATVMGERARIGVLGAHIEHSAGLGILSGTLDSSENADHS